MYIIQSHFQSKLLKIPARFNCKNTEEYVDTINSCLFESVGGIFMLHTWQRKIDLPEFYKFNVTNECSMTTS